VNELEWYVLKLERRLERGEFTKRKRVDLAV